MKSLKNENVVQAIEDFMIKEKEKLYVILEYVNGGSLQDLLDRSPNNKLPLRQLRKIFKGLISGLIYLQGQGIIHRDIKPDNILLTSEGDVKIADLGVAIKIDISDESILKEFKWGQGDVGGSPAFQPPECQEIDISSIPDLDELVPLITKRDGKIAPFKLDIWSAGVVLYIMVVGKFPFDSPNIISLFTNIARGKFTIPEWVGSELTDLLKCILQVDPDNRFSLQQIKKHSWMKMSIKESSSIPIDPIPSLFGNDHKTLYQVTDDLFRRNSDTNSGHRNIEEDYTDTNSDNTSEDHSSSLYLEDKIEPEPPQKKEKQTLRKRSSSRMKSLFKQNSKNEVKGDTVRRASSEKFSRRLSLPSQHKNTVDNPSRLERRLSLKRIDDSNKQKCIIL